jgi:hypothetical protein
MQAHFFSASHCSALHCDVLNEGLVICAEVTIGLTRKALICCLQDVMSVVAFVSGHIEKPAKRCGDSLPAFVSWSGSIPTTVVRNSMVFETSILAK